MAIPDISFKSREILLCDQVLQQMENGFIFMDRSLSLRSPKSDETARTMRCKESKKI